MPLIHWYAPNLIPIGIWQQPVAEYKNRNTTHPRQWENPIDSKKLNLNQDFEWKGWSVPEKLWQGPITGNQSSFGQIPFYHQSSRSRICNQRYSFQEYYNEQENKQIKEILIKKYAQCWNWMFRGLSILLLLFRQRLTVGQ